MKEWKLQSTTANWFHEKVSFHTVTVVNSLLCYPSEGIRENEHAKKVKSLTHQNL